MTAPPNLVERQLTSGHLAVHGTGMLSCGTVNFCKRRSSHDSLAAVFLSAKRLCLLVVEMTAIMHVCPLVAAPAI